MKIAAFIHLDEISGSCLVTLQNAQKLSQKGHQVIFVTPAKGPLYSKATQMNLDAVCVTNPSVALSESSFNSKAKLLIQRFKYIRRVRKFFKDNKIELVYIGSTGSIFAGIAAYLSKIPVVWHVHEAIESPGLFRKVKLKLIAAIASKFLFASHRSRELFPLPRKTPHRVAKNYIDVTKLTSYPKIHYTDQAPLRIVVNGAGFSKGFDVLLNALITCVRSSPDFRFHLTVLGSPPDSSQIINLTKSPELDETIHYTGFIENAPEIISQNHLLISPSRNEALPLILIEAMGIGVPVIATNVGDCARLLDYGKRGIIIEPEDIRGLSESILSIFYNYPIAESTAKAAQDFILTEYGSPHFWDEFLDFLHLEKNGIIGCQPMEE